MKEVLAIYYGSIYALKFYTNFFYLLESVEIYIIKLDLLFFGQPYNGEFSERFRVGIKEFE